MIVTHAMRGFESRSDVTILPVGRKGAAGANQGFTPKAEPPTGRGFRITPDERPSFVGDRNYNAGASLFNPAFILVAATLLNY